LEGSCDSLRMRLRLWERREVHGLKFLLRFQNLLRNARPKALALSELKDPIRAELFSSERLEGIVKLLEKTKRSPLGTAMQPPEVPLLHSKRQRPGFEACDNGERAGDAV
jgi:hypothetical protein